jgi:hypothetical protein
VEVDQLNELHGINVPHLQVLKSAAGYFIGSLCKADWHPTFWEPNFRHSEQYWETREDAESALITGLYDVKIY